MGESVFEVSGGGVKRIGLLRMGNGINGSLVTHLAVGWAMVVVRGQGWSATDITLPANIC